MIRQSKTARKRTQTARRAAGAKIGIVALPGVQLLDVAGPADVFAEAADQLGRPDAYEVRVLGMKRGPVRTSCGVRLHVDDVVGDSAWMPDTLLVAGSPAMPDATESAAFHDALRAASTRVDRLGSVCSGAFALARAGLLAGCRVATHWRVAGKLARVHPDIDVDADAIWIRDGRIWSSAGVTAGIDLALSMVEEDHGRELALAVARQLVVFLQRPGGQSQFSAHLAAQVAERSVIRKVQDHVLAHLGADLGVPALAARAGMSERNLARLFQTEVGMSVAKFVEKARLEAARRALETADVPLKKLADTLGYATADSFRRAFVRHLGTTPVGYRKRFAL